MRRLSLVLASLSLIAACGGGGGTAPDADRAIPDGHGPDATAPDASTDCNVLFLNFEGVTILEGVDNATTDHSSIVANASSPIAAFQNGQAGRDALIATITAQVQAALSPLGVSVVSTRPASGNYDMIVFGGASTDLGLSAGVVALGPSIGCVPVPDAVGFVFDGTGVPDYQWGNWALGTYGIMLGLPMSTQVNDCMCYAAVQCDNDTAACTIGGATTPRDPNAPCGSGGTFDEHGTFVSELACP